MQCHGKSLAGETKDCTAKVYLTATANDHATTQQLVAELSILAQFGSCVGRSRSAHACRSSRQIDVAQSNAGRVNGFICDIDSCGS